ncbi:hypothetical protein FFK22_020165 [Mycobacterium sp. KBS0706]|uniref:hypothetical protein n=1 Tax=Mycobacterium sp. KBS0706 TaxID=2578109 RepID=UPI00110F9339|nr:hypothetical protein [Mycobacterium sp. KBS0706]TSD86910.1 hypothetical protein FFK22_020165 [Mycobacterium sp. KBS0706]
MLRFLRMALTAAAMLAIAGGAAAAPLGYEDPHILRVESSPGQALASYTPEQIKTAFPQRVIETGTPWSEAGETIRYRGPELKDVLARSGLGEAASIEVFAYDDFITTIHMDEIKDYEPILAIERGCSAADHKNGRCADGQEFRPLDLADSGPYSIIWPLDQLPKSYTAGRNAIWVWFVVALRPGS